MYWIKLESRDVFGTRKIVTVVVMVSEPKHAAFFHSGLRTESRIEMTEEEKEKQIQWMQKRPIFQ